MNKSESRQEAKDLKVVVMKALKSIGVEISPTTIGDKLSKGGKTVTLEEARVDVYRVALKKKGSDTDWYMYTCVSKGHKTTNTSTSGGKTNKFFGISESVLVELDSEEVDYCVCLIDKDFMDDNDLDSIEPHFWLLSKSDLQLIRKYKKVASDGAYKINAKDIADILTKAMKNEEATREEEARKNGEEYTAKPIDTQYRHTTTIGFCEFMDNLE